MFYYQPLQDFLAASGDRPVHLSFKDIEELIGRPLPPSAFSAVSRQWWSNAPSHVQARAWLNLKRKAKLNLAEHAVTFSRPISSTTEPETVVFKAADLHPMTLRMLESIAAESEISIGSAAAALLTTAAKDRGAKDPVKVGG